MNFLMMSFLLGGLIACSTPSKKKVEGESEIVGSTALENSKVVAKVNFDFDSARLKTESKQALLDVIKLTKSMPDEYTVMVTGHTDLVGTEDYNYDLGLERAQTIREFMLDHGVSKTKVQALSFGENDPLVETDEKTRLRINRRAIVEVFPTGNLLPKDSLSYME